MSFDKLKEQIALLRLANLIAPELKDLAFFTAADLETLEDLELGCAVAAKLDLRRTNMTTEHRRLVCAAATMLLIEAESMTPFDRWLASGDKFKRTPGEIAALREAFEAGSKLNG